MHIKALRIRNFRRLRDVCIDLSPDISIFVGANNSGKTSVSQALQMFTSDSQDKFTIYDFRAETWSQMVAFGEEEEGAVLPSISLDIWFHVDAPDLHRVIDLLPSLSWQGSLVGLRIEFAAADEKKLLENFKAARSRAQENMSPGIDVERQYCPFPRNLQDYLKDKSNLRREYELRYFVLDQAGFDVSLVEKAYYVPSRLTPDKGRGGREILKSLLKVDFLNAQRHLSDHASGSRTEDLSRCLSRFYLRNLDRCGEDYDAIRALAEAEGNLNAHLRRVFQPTLRRLSCLGYPGLNNPSLHIISALEPASIMSSHDGASVHYALGDSKDGIEPPTLPDRYNGLGYKNLIYMVVELLSLHTQWMEIEENRPPLHLIFIEEPETHLHAQLQQVFIRKVNELLAIDGEDKALCSSQLIVTTHSPHILYERGFRPIRYFRRCSNAVRQYSEVLNLSNYYDCLTNENCGFLERYLKLTHCDLFFADAAILVEGNVERLLLPQMIAKEAPRLQTAYLSILEIGGAFGHRFRSLIEFIGITTLIVTDIDSVIGPVVLKGVDGDVDENNDEESVGVGSACRVQKEDAVTSNQTLKQWLPMKHKISDLLGASPEERTQLRVEENDALIRVTYQTPVNAQWRGETIVDTGRTLEEAFVLENLDWCQDAAHKDLNLYIRGNGQYSADGLVEKLHKRIVNANFKKTDFALALLGHDPESWNVPRYIAEGLRWLETEITPESPAFEYDKTGADV